MELRVLRYFLAVAKEESITGAAERWGVIMRRDSPLAQKEFILPKDLPLIISRQTMQDKIFKIGSAPT